MHTHLKRWTPHEGTYICKLKQEGKPYTVKWDIMDRAPVFNPVTRKCRLCLKEIFYILFRPASASLNTRSELFNTCRHRNQKLLEKMWFQTFLFGTEHYLNPSVSHSSSPSDECGAFHMKQICKGYEHNFDLLNIILCIFTIIYLSFINIIYVTRKPN